MAEKQYKYTAKIKQPQTVVNVKLDPNGGLISEREIKTVKKDAYGASLLEKRLLVIEDTSVSESAPSGENQGETIPDFEGENTSTDRPQDHAGWKPE
jgi:hypothetical protein